MRYFRVLYRIMKANVQLKAMYKFNFWLSCATDIINYAVQLLIMLSIYNGVDDIVGWSQLDIMLFLGTFAIIDSLAMAFFFIGIVTLPSKIQSGRLDLQISKPMNSLFLVATENFQFSFLFNLIYGVALVIYCVVQMNLTITFAIVAGYCALIILMFSLFFALMLTINCAAFWFIRISGLSRLNDEFLSFSSRIPGSLYKGLSKLIFLIIIPYGLIASVPSQFILGKINEINWISISVIVILYWIIALFIWTRGLKRYNSASS